MIAPVFERRYFNCSGSPVTVPMNDFPIKFIRKAAPKIIVYEPTLCLP